MLNLIALPTPILMRSTLARRAAEYAAVERARTVATWDATEMAQAQIIMTIPTAQRRSFHSLVRERRA